MSIINRYFRCGHDLCALASVAFLKKCHDADDSCGLIPAMNEYSQHVDWDSDREWRGCIVFCGRCSRGALLAALGGESCSLFNIHGAVLGPCLLPTVDVPSFAGDV